MAANKTIQGGFGEASNQNSPLNNLVDQLQKEIEELKSVISSTD